MGAQIESERPEEEPLRRAARAIARERDARETFEEEIRQELAAIRKDVAELKGGQRSETYRVIGAVVLAIVTALGGREVLAKPAPTPQITVHRDALSIEVEACGKLADDVARGVWVAGAIARHTR